MELSTSSDLLALASLPTLYA